MKLHRRPKRSLLMLGATFLGIVALTFIMIGCNDLSTESSEPGDTTPASEVQPVETNPGEEPMEPTPGEPQPGEPTPAEPQPAEPTPAEPQPAEPTPAPAPGVPPVDEGTIKNLTAGASAFDPSQINVMGSANFGDWAAAYVGVSGQESQLAIFHYNGSAWELYDMGSYVEPSDLPPGIPTEVSNWAFP